jgi:hypothetical protein
MSARPHPISISPIVANPQFVSYLYGTIVRKAGKKAAAKEHFSNHKDLCMVKYSTPTEGRLRATCDEELAKAAVGRLGYDPDDITILGGTALNLYSSMLTTNYRIPPLPPSNVSTYKTYMETDDIDMVWWPYIDPALEAGHTVLSKGLHDFCKDFVNEINENLREGRREIEGFVEYALQQPVSLALNCTLSDYIDIGVNTATIIFKINGTPYKIAEIMIHDGFSSQRNDFLGTPIRYLLPMVDDVSYISKYARAMANRPYFNVMHGVALADLEKFIVLQFFLLGNTLRERPDMMRVAKAWGRAYYLDALFGKLIFEAEQLGLRGHIMLDARTDITDLMNVFDEASETLRSVYAKEIADLCGELPEGRLFHASLHSFCVTPNIPASIPRDSALYTRIRDMSRRHRGMAKASVQEAYAEMGRGGGTRRRRRGFRKTRSRQIIQGFRGMILRR